MGIITFILTVLEKHGIEKLCELIIPTDSIMFGLYDFGPYGKISIEMFNDVVNNPDHYKQFIND